MSIPQQQVNKEYGIIEDKRLGGIPRYYLGYPDDWNMWIPDEIKNCVAFICVKKIENGKDYYIPCGTVFFVSVPDDSNKIDFYYLITAKHVVEEALRYSEISVRVNYKDGKAKNLIFSKTAKWFFHPTDENVDVAITPFPLFTKELDVRTIPSSMFLSEDKIKDKTIGIGNEVFITGLFLNHYGKQKNLPIIRVGNIAMMSDKDEKVSVNWHGKAEIEAHLIEARSIGGISGSPVFFCDSLLKNGKLTLTGQPQFYLGGLIHGHFGSSEIDNTQETEIEKSKKYINMGIAIVIPASKITETLKQKELEEMRIALKKEWDKKNTSTKLD